MKSPAKSRTLPSIAGKLREQGYATDFLYGGDINFTNMKSYLLGSGYQHLTADVDFSLEERKNPWGVNDDITFEYLYQQIKARTGNQPWHTAFLTLSSHEPFEVPYHRLNEKIPNAFAFTDDCLGKFIDNSRRFHNGRTCSLSACRTMASIIRKRDWCTTRASITSRCSGWVVP